jgi:hypothetical protein
MAKINGQDKAISLHSDRLAVEIAAPGTVYRGTRFDWTAFITQVTLDGKHTFCVPESNQSGYGTGGIGLCNEFGIEKVIGYTDIKPGEPFPKLGIGLLKRPDDSPYNFGKLHEIANLFQIEIETGPAQAKFVVAPLDCRGVAVRLTKTVSVQQQQLTIAYLLENTGSKVVDTHEYCHNFLGIDRQLIGPDYRLRFPYHIELEKLPFIPGPLPEILAFDGGDFSLRSTPQPQTAFYFRPLGYSQTQAPQWELVHLPSGVGLREYDDFAPRRVAVWGTTHVISAEIFIDIHLEPGQSLAWTRRFEFFDKE